jgi:hypothetical protein
MRDRGESVEEGVVSEDEKKRGKRTSLLNSSLNIYPIRDAPTEKGGNLNVTEGSPNEEPKPRGEVSALKYQMNPGMVAGVEGLGRVEKKEEPVNLLLYPSVEVSVNVDCVVTPAPSSQKAFLSGINQVEDSRHNGPRGERCKDAVISVSDA